MPSFARALAEALPLSQFAASKSAVGAIDARVIHHGRGPQRRHADGRHAAQPSHRGHAAGDRALVLSSAGVLRVRRGETVFHPGDDVEAAFFPLDAMISLVIVMPGGETAETGLIGPEGAIGGLISAGHKPAFARAVAQIPGQVLRVPVDVLERAKSRSAALHDLMARYTDCFAAQLLQTIACNALHPLDQRLPRWLISVQDRMGGGDIALTQESLAEMLGVQRTTVTAEVAALRRHGALAEARGLIRIRERRALEARSCSCHASVRMHYERMLPGVYAAQDIGGIVTPNVG